MASELGGYKGQIAKLLAERGVRVSDRIRVKFGDLVLEGILMPRYELADEYHLVIKLDNGYNVGVRFAPDVSVERIAEKVMQRAPKPKLELKEGLPRVAILATGGTIASRVDYRTGGVRPVVDPADLYSIFPELVTVANIETEVVMNVYSENLTPSHWARIAESVAKAIARRVDGVVVMHGTDTMGFTAAALAFALRDLPVPVVLVGSQRSSDRPSSDAALNLKGAVLAASKFPTAEVMVCMHKGTSDDVLALHRGTRVRKMHTSARYAFKTVDAPLVGEIVGDEIRPIAPVGKPRDKSRALRLLATFEEKVALLKFYPGFDPALIDFLVDSGYKGIIIEGTGLGHVSEKSIPSIKRAVESGVFIGITSQCIFGRTHLAVYETGRFMMRAGAVPLENMLSETAYVKLSWCLAQERDLEKVRQLMLTNLAGEIEEVSPFGEPAS